MATISSYSSSNGSDSKSKTTAKCRVCQRHFVNNSSSNSNNNNNDNKESNSEWRVTVDVIYHPPNTRYPYPGKASICLDEECLSKVEQLNSSSGLCDYPPFEGKIRVDTNKLKLSLLLGEAGDEVHGRGSISEKQELRVKQILPPFDAIEWEIV